jgi:plastocyanin
MRFSTRTLLPAVALAHYAAAANHAVGVGEGGLVFKPDSMMAAVGDTVTFEFYPRNHSVVQSTFEKPWVSPLRSRASSDIDATGGPWNKKH